MEKETPFKHTGILKPVFGPDFIRILNAQDEQVCIVQGRHKESAELHIIRANLIRYWLERGFNAYMGIPEQSILDRREEE